MAAVAISLDAKLAAALDSRDQRNIRRRLPPATDATAAVLTDFSSNDYLSLSSSPTLRARFLAKLSVAPEVLGAGGSRLLVNAAPHAALEARLAAFFHAPTALLFNSGFDANAAFFACIPQPGDFLVHDAAIHASVHDGARASRAAARVPFAHNSLPALRTVLLRLRAEQGALRSGASAVFLAVESVYSMDGTVAPLREMVDLMEALFPLGNAYVVVDEAHATGVYGPQGRGLVALLGLDDRVLARLHTFGKALAGTGAVVLTSVLVRDYMLNYARPLIYTTALSHPNVIAADCAFDLLEDGTAQQLADALLSLSTYFVSTLRTRLRGISPNLVSLPAYLSLSSLSPPPLPTPIIPVLTPHPRPLSAHLRSRGLDARAITWPTVPKGADRVRICLHAGNTRADVDALVNAIVEWAEAWREAASGWDIAEKDEDARIVAVAKL